MSKADQPGNEKSSDVVIKFLLNKSLYIEVLEQILDNHEHHIESTTSSLAVALKKTPATLSEPLNELVKRHVLAKTRSKDDSRIFTYKPKRKEEFKHFMIELKENLERNQKEGPTYEHKQLEENLLGKMVDKCRRVISSKIKAERDKLIGSTFRNWRADLVLSLDNINIGIEIKSALNRVPVKQLLEITIQNHCHELIGTYITSKKNVNGLLLIEIVPGLSTEVKGTLVKAVEDLSNENLNIGLFIISIDKKELESEAVLDLLTDEIITKVVALLKQSNLRHQRLRDEVFRPFSFAVDDDRNEGYIYDELLTPSKKDVVKIIGIGGAGNNIISRLKDSWVPEAQFIAIDSDSASLNFTSADKKILIGKREHGLGCGGSVEKGKEAIEQSLDEVRQAIGTPKLVIVCAGMGGGTGTGAANVIGKLVKDVGALLIGFVTLPFDIEQARVDKAKTGYEALLDVYDSVVILDNNSLAKIAGYLPVEQSFAVSNELLANSIRAIINPIFRHMLINLSLADIESLFKKSSIGTIAIGSSDGSDRVAEAVVMALSNPLASINIKQAKGAVIYVVGGPDMTLDEVTRVGELISMELNEEANVMWSAVIKDTWKDKLTVTVILTGFENIDY